MKTEVILNGMAIILFLGFGAACVIAFTILDKQKDIIIPSRYGRQIEPLEIIYVNAALLLIGIMLYEKSYRFLPALIVFVLMIFFNSRMVSGISHEGIFIGATFLDWNKLDGFRIINDEISTIQVRVYANKKQYILRCDKELRRKVEHLFIGHQVDEIASQNAEP